MKWTLFALCLLWTAAAFTQTAAVDSQPQIIHVPSHPARAVVQPMAAETSLFVPSGSVWAQGQRPLWEFAAKRTIEIPLGDVARMYRKEHETAKKAVLVKYD